MLSAIDQAILKKAKHKEMLSLYRKALTSVSKIKCINVRINIEARFCPDELHFNITVYTKDIDNVGFDFYDFHSIEETTTNLNRAINVIKTDDFLKIKAAARAS